MSYSIRWIEFIPACIISVHFVFLYFYVDFRFLVDIFRIFSMLGVLHRTKTARMNVRTWQRVSQRILRGNCYMTVATTEWCRGGYSIGSYWQPSAPVVYTADCCRSHQSYRGTTQLGLLVRIGSVKQQDQMTVQQTIHACCCSAPRCLHRLAKHQRVAKFHHELR